MEEIIKAGDTVEYLSIVGRMYVKVLRVKEGGKLILNTREGGIMAETCGRYVKDELVKLSKNVCVLPTRVKKIN